MFTKTVVKCSHPGCEEEAITKVACPWIFGRYSELKTFGFACSDHVDAVLERAKQRPSAMGLAEGEKLGTITTYDLEAYC